MKLKLSTMMEWNWFWSQVRARTSLQLELYGRDVWITSPPGSPPMRLHLLDLGPEHPAQTLVLIHGFSGASISFQPLLPLARRYRILALDLRGHGRSDRPADGYTVAQMADDIAAALDALGVDKPVVVVGSSAGGFVATELALRYPDRVSRVVLITSPVVIREEALPRPLRALMHNPDRLIRVMNAIPGLIPEGSSYHVGTKRFYQDLLRWDGTQQYPRLRQPTLVITGVLDNLLGPSDFTRVAALIPQAEHVNVGTADHMLPFERPEAVLRAMERFLAADPSAPFAPHWRSANDDVDSPRLLAERPWVARYDDGVPATLDIPPVPLTRLLDVAARRFGTRPALRYEGQTITYGELVDEVDRFAQVLHQLGIGPGDRIMLVLPNSPHWAVAFFGTLRVGAIAVLAQGSVEGLLAQARHTRARVLVTTEVATARQVLAASPVAYLIFASAADYGRGYLARRAVAAPQVMPGQPELAWPDLLAARAPAGVADAATPDDTAVILFTGGSAPTAIRLTHRNLVANALQIGAWLHDIRPGQESVLSAVPFSHAYGLATALNVAISLAATLVLPRDFSVDAVLDQLRRERPGVLVAVPHLYIELGDVPHIRRYFAGRPRLCLSGAAPLAVETKEAFERLTHTPVIEGYERSEVGQLVLNPLQSSRTGSVGLPLPDIEARVLDLADGTPVPPGAIGELVVRGPQVMAGYGADDTAARGLDAEGWFHTGDLACMDDDGYFQVLGRRADVWRTPSGEVVYPRDVEETIHEIPDVDEVAVVAVENQPVAFVRPDEGVTLTMETVLDVCARRLPPFHQPQAVIFVDEFPRNPVGRILRDVLIRQHAAEVAALALPPLA
ncbi:MAG TPA: alpha/beta fold hydrolase [Herpetosiphonaceae bacterium]